MQKPADLHIHTIFSDSTFTPAKVVEVASNKGLGCIAITDHDSCQGIKDAIDAGIKKGIEIIPGVELSAELDEEELHILGYFIDWEREVFKERLNIFQSARKERALQILNKLREKGIDLNAEELFQISGKGSIGRPHIAQLMYRKGAVYSIHEAFVKYLGNNACCYVKRMKVYAKEAIELIKDMGGISILAHPKTINVELKSLDEILSLLISYGLQGIEVYHTDHKNKDIERLNSLAKRYNLLITGGSDCHGLNNREVLIGKVRIPYELVEKLRNANVRT